MYPPERIGLLFGRIMSASNQPSGSSPSAVVAAGDEETRVLLRGLLRLHHFTVDGEAEGAIQALELLRTHRPGILVVDVNLAEGSPAALVADARAILPSLRVILVAPASRPPPVMGVARQGPDVVLLRPFRIRQFAEAVAPTVTGATPAGPAAAVLA
jgi:DNA-binding NarL/FixJ family response regulator